MEQEEFYNEVIQRILEKEKNGEPLNIGEAAMLSSYSQEKKPKFDFSGVKVIKDNIKDFEER